MTGDTPMRSAKVVYFKNRETIVRQGEPQNGFYILRDGKLDIFKNDIFIKTVSHENRVFVGESASLLETTHTCTVVANGEVKTIFIQGDLKTLIELHPENALELVTDLAKKLADATNEIAELKLQLSKLMWAAGELDRVEDSPDIAGGPAPKP